MSKRTVLLVVCAVGAALAVMLALSRLAGRSERAAGQPQRPARPSSTTPRISPSPAVFETSSELSGIEATALSEPLRLILGFGPETDYRARMNAVHALGTSLKPADIHALYAFLHIKHEPAGKLGLLEQNAIKNDIVDKLIKQRELPPGLGRQIVEMYRDRSFDAMWRDYCLQHFAPYYERKWAKQTETEKDEEAREVLQALWDATLETEGGFAGTALIGLERLASSRGAADRGKVSDRALEIAVSERYDAKARVTALQTCAMLGRKEVAGTARVLAQSGEIIGLRLAAIAALGEVGGAEDEELLRSLAATQVRGKGDPGALARQAAERALARVKEGEK